SINIGLINGGNAPNVVADQCIVAWQYRLHPGDDLVALFQEYKLMIEDELRPSMAHFPQAKVTTEYVSEVPVFMATEGGAGERFLCPLTGSGVPVSVSYGTEAGIYQSLAPSVVICGPGSITKAHQPDEFVPVADLDKCCSLINMAIESLK
ncbi:MAG: M20/M25/M40 family metallo-hydrolase, partial [Alphaproteobacteria bacterium]|nr:M20/M25/M40 family metallo-hydrolase [Alphaproteobacteria bacterium]